MRIGIRLWVGFGLVLAMGLAAAVIASTGMEAVSNLAKDLYRHPFLISNQALQTQMEIMSLRGAMLRIALSQDEEDTRRLVDEAGSLEGRIHAGLANLEGQFRGDMRHVDAAKRGMADWGEVRGRVMLLALAGDRATAAQVARTEGAQAFDAAIHSMEFMVEFERAKASSLFAEVVLHGDGIVHKAIAVFAVSLVVGALVAFAVTCSITGPLARVREAMVALSAGDLSVPVPEKDRRDEIGDVARDLEVWKRNVAERLHAEEHLRLLSEAMAQSSNSVIVTNAKGDMVYVNQRFCQLTGYEPQDVIGKSPAILKSPSTPRATHAKLWAAITRGVEWQGELEDIRKDGESVWVLSTIAPIRDQDGTITHFVAIQQDITERKRFEAELQRARDMAEVANRTKSELLANMSHELRTPLNAIIGFASVIAEQAYGRDHAKYQEYGRDIHASGEHLLELISDILDASAMEAGKMTLRDQPVDLAAVVEAAMRIVRGRAAEGEVALLVDLDPTLGSVVADERRFKQILLNLLSNAVKFTGPGGTVRLSTKRLADGGLAVAVADSGIGMDEAGIATALTPFGQVDSPYARRNQGTGLGLPLAKGLIEAHGGSLSIESVLGKGTTVTVTLPRERCGVAEVATG